MLGGDRHDDAGLQRLWLRIRQPDLVVADLDHVGEVLEVGPPVRAIVVVAHHQEGEHDVVGTEILAVVPLHPPGPQRVGEGLTAVGRLHVGGQRGLDVELCVVAHQPVVDQLQDVIGLSGVGGERVQRVDVGGGPDPQHGAACGLRSTRRQRSRAAECGRNHRRRPEKLPTIHR